MPIIEKSEFLNLRAQLAAVEAERDRYSSALEKLLSHMLKVGLFDAIDKALQQELKQAQAGEEE